MSITSLQTEQNLISTARSVSVHACTCVWNRSIHSWCDSQQSTALPTLSFSGSQITLGVAFSQLSSEDLMANYPQINISLLRRGRHRGSGRLSLLIEGLKKEEKRVWSKPPWDGPTSCFPSAATSSSPEEPVGSLKIIIKKNLLYWKIMCCTYGTKYTVVVKQGIAMLTLTRAMLSIAFFFSFFFQTGIHDRKRNCSLRRLFRPAEWVNCGSDRKENTDQI